MLPAMGLAYFKLPKLMHDVAIFAMKSSSLYTVRMDIFSILVGILNLSIYLNIYISLKRELSHNRL